MATYKFKNMSQFNAYAEKKIKLILEDIGDLVMAKLKYNVNNSVYNWTPVRYKRTKQVLNSISRTDAVKVDGKYVVEIYFDPLKIRPIINKGSWNAHASFKGEWAMSDISGSNLITWLERGTPNNKYYQHESHEFVKDTVEWIKGEYLVLFKRELEKYGVSYK